MAAGLADDVVTAICLATAAPVVVAPAMDGEMWSHPATRANADTLRGFGYTIVEPEDGPLASGAEGRGRLAETPTIVAAAVAAVAGRPIRVADPALRPPLASGRSWPGPRGPHDRGQRRRHGRAHRPGPLHRQPLERPDGRGHRRGRAGPRRARDARRGHASACRCPRTGPRSCERRRPPRCAARCWPRCRAPTRWSWPPPWPTSGPRPRPPPS